jgi:tetratricopeptide (TPR) repeat protein
VYDDKIDHPTSPENLLHYKFHDSIILTAQRYFTENSARYQVDEMHRRIARRARDLMHEDKAHYRGSNVVSRFTRPAQVITHLLASIDHQNRDQDAAAPQIVAPMDLDRMEEGEEHWKDIWRGTSVARVHLYCFGEIYRRFIDRTHRQSHLHGADRAKVDLLIRFLFLDRSEAPRNLEQAVLPQLPINLLCELLEGLAISALNCGELDMARWAVARARDMLAEWKRAGLDLPQERRDMVEAVTRVHADILVRGGHLAAAKQVCREALCNAESDFLQVARPAERDKLKVRHGNIIFMTEGVAPAIKYMETIGLAVAGPGGLPEFRSIDLTGLPGRLWVGLLLRAMRHGRPPEAQIAILEQAFVVHQYNHQRWKDQGNEQLALHVEKSMLDRVSRRAIEERNPDIVDAAKLPDCLKLLKDGQSLAWKRGVSPATRMELDIELAKVLYLGGDTERALGLLKESLTMAVASRYRCYEYDMLMLKAEILWSTGRKDDAEDLFKRLVEIEGETGYRTSGLISFITAGFQPTRMLPG